MSPYVDISFDFDLEIILEPFSISSPVGESIVASRVYKNCVVSIFCQDTVVDLIHINILEFDVIMGIDSLHSCYSTLYCRTRKVTFYFSNETVLTRRVVP